MLAIPAIRRGAPERVAAFLKIRGRSCGNRKPSATRGGPQLRGGELTAMLPRDQRYVAIAATLPHELANEKDFPEIHRANGALTFYLLKALERARPENHISPTNG